MLKALIKKQYYECFRSYFVNVKTGKARSKAGIAGMFVFFAVLMLFLCSVFFGMSLLLGSLFEVGLSWLYFALMGVVSIALAVNARTGVLAAQPVVSAMGFLYDSEHARIEAACRQHLANIVARVAASGNKVKEAVSSGQMQGQLRSFLYERTKRRPVVLINLIEVE